ncbi:hypothetical protein [Haloarchaeobius sp. DYHT-AS-18]|uniref:hypothetical protein n=1 Tax=Haloarchaeobius sp. DYHT-AS-18 TaxID=3446117 RepID=UPI003EBAF4B1
MPTLPDGASVVSKSFETFESIGFDPGRSRATEGFEEPIFVMGDFSISVTETIIEAGGSTTVNGTATDDTGAAQSSAPYSVKAENSDGTVVVTSSGTTAVDGSFSESLIIDSPGEYACYAENDAVGQQSTDDFESIGIDFPTLRVSEGFEQ